MASVPKPTAPSTDEQLTRALAQEWVKYYNARDIDKLVSLYTEDGSLLPSFYPMTQGTTAMRQYFVDVFHLNDPRDLTVETTYVKIIGDSAFGIGTYKDNMKMPNGKRVDVPGKWTAMLRRVAWMLPSVSYASARSGVAVSNFARCR